MRRARRTRAVVVRRTAEVVRVPTRAEFTERIRGLLAKTVAAILETGDAIQAAKDALEHGEFTGMLADVGLNATAAQRFMKAARYPPFRDPAISPHLPASREALAGLARMPPDLLAEVVRSGRVTPETTVEEAEALVKRIEPPDTRQRPLPITPHLHRILLPEVVRKPRAETLAVRVVFANEEDRADFAALIGQDVTPKTKTITYRRVPRPEPDIEFDRDGEPIRRAVDTDDVEF